MMFFGRHGWTGETGRTYTFKCALTKNGIPNDSGGIYVFVRRRFGFFLQALYVGKAANLRGRLIGHEKWGKAWWILGATERHVMRVATEEERRKIEEDLIRGLKPRMNDVQMPRCEDDAPNWFAGVFGMKRKHDHEGHAHEHKQPSHKKAAPANNGFWS